MSLPRAPAKVPSPPVRARLRRFLPCARSPPSATLHQFVAEELLHAEGFTDIRLQVSAPQSRAAVSATVSSTGCTSAVERLMTLSTSLVAVWYSSDSWRSRVRAYNSPSSRAFSIAMTAWSAKVRTSSICRSVYGVVNLAARGMLVVSVARRLGSEGPLRTYCAARSNLAGAGKRHAESDKLTIPVGRPHTFAARDCPRTGAVEGLSGGY